jgi:hypothetical protein
MAAIESPEKVGLRPFGEFVEANETWPRGDRPAAIREAAAEFRARFASDENRVRAVRTVPIDRGELRQAALGCLGGWGGKSRSRGEAAIAVAWTREWLEQIDSLVRELEAPAAEVAASAAARWWR